MNEAVRACFSKYATFSGRASRSEYWYFYLFFVIAYFAAGIVGAIVHAPSIALLVFAGLFIPLLAAEVRRMHDTNHAGWFLLIPIYGFILACTGGDKESNKYGEPQSI